MTHWGCTTRDTDETLALGAALGRVLRDLDCGQLTLSLEGELGTGKTVFVRGLARGIGVAASTQIVSPTYTIARAYVVPAGRIGMLHHLDAYRLEGPEDLDAIGFEEMCGIGCVTCVEWGAKVEDVLPEDRMRMFLQAQPPEHLLPGEAPECPRSVQVEALGPEAARILEAWSLSFRAWQRR